MPLGTGVNLGPGDVVLDGDPAPSPKRGQSPLRKFLVHFYCDLTAGCIKMPLRMEVGFSSRDFVLDGDLPLPKKGSAPNYWPMSLVAKRLDGSRWHLA